MPFLKTSFSHISLIQILISQNAVFTLPIRKLLLKYVCVKSKDPILWSLSGNDKVYGTNKLKLSCIFFLVKTLILLVTWPKSFSNIQFLYFPYSLNFYLQLEESLALHLVKFDSPKLQDASSSLKWYWPSCSQEVINVNLVSLFNWSQQR